MKTGLTNRESTCSQPNSPELLDELATILTRQKKKIDDALEGEAVMSSKPRVSVCFILLRIEIKLLFNQGFFVFLFLS